jgi:hypothetical protein
MAFRNLPPIEVVPDSPEKILLQLPRRKMPGVLLHQGQMMQAYVAGAYVAPDVALQLPTGSGKTLVGLLIAEWRRRKNRDRVVYLCPTRRRGRLSESGRTCSRRARPFADSADSDQAAQVLWLSRDRRKPAREGVRHHPVLGRDGIAAKPTQRDICCRTFAPALPENPAASVKDYCSGAHIRHRGLY